MAVFLSFEYRTASGNPGYIMGLPVLFRYENSSTSAVSSQADSLRVQSPIPDSAGLPVGLCPSADISASYLSSLEVEFGYDVTTGCMLLLNR